MSKREAEDMIIRLQEEGRAKRWPVGTAPLGAVSGAAPARCDRRLRDLVASDKYRHLRSLGDSLRSALTKKKDDLVLNGSVTKKAFRDAVDRLVRGEKKKKVVDGVFDLIDADGDGKLSKREIHLFLKDVGGSWTRTAFPPAIDVADDKKLVRVEPLVRALVTSDPPLRLEDDDEATSDRFKRVKAVAKKMGRNVLATENDKLLDDDTSLKPSTRTLSRDARKTNALKSRARRSIEQLRAAFAAVERKNSSGMVSWNDFADVIHSRKLTRGVSADDIEEVRRALTAGGGRAVDWRAFLDLVDFALAFSQQHPQDPDSAATVRRVFRQADADDDGFLTRREVLEALDHLPHLPNNLDHTLFHALDKDASGFVAYPDVVDFVLSRRAHTHVGGWMTSPGSP